MFCASYLLLFDILARNRDAYRDTGDVCHTVPGVSYVEVTPYFLCRFPQAPQRLPRHRRTSSYRKFERSRHTAPVDRRRSSSRGRRRARRTATNSRRRLAAKVCGVRLWSFFASFIYAMCLCLTSCRATFSASSRHACQHRERSLHRMKLASPRHE